MLNRTTLIAMAVFAILGFAAGFFTGKAIYDRPLEEKVERDTVWLIDTVPDYNPSPKDSATIKWVTKWLPSKPVHDTISSVEYYALHDTVAVEVPITSKHYGNDTYDAWVSGFEPSLDSIRVYQKTQIITETITRMKPPNKAALSVITGVDYNTTQQNWRPYALGELMLNNHKRLSIGVNGGVEYNIGTKNVEPVVGGKIKIRVF